jgi:hypothetical protein
MIIKNLKGYFSGSARFLVIKPKSAYLLQFFWSLVIYLDKLSYFLFNVLSAQEERPHIENK